jgi:hypothetical protein
LPEGLAAASASDPSDESDVLEADPAGESEGEFAMVEGAESAVTLRLIAPAGRAVVVAAILKTKIQMLIGMVFATLKSERRGRARDKLQTNC